MIRCFIIEDEPPARAILTRLIKDRKDLNLAGFAEDAITALNFLRGSPVDLIFLDVQLPGMSGFEFLQELDVPAAVVFTTAGGDHAIPAFDYGAIDFLLKPFNRERFDKAVNRVVQAFQSNAPASVKQIGLPIRENENHYLIPHSSILYLSSRGKATAIHTTERDFETSKLLGDIEARLPDTFIRIHKQFIVNSAFVLSISSRLGGGHTLSLKDSDETSLPVGRQFSAKVKSLFASSS